MMEVENRAGKITSHRIACLLCASIGGLLLFGKELVLSIIIVGFFGMTLVPLINSTNHRFVPGFGFLNLKSNARRIV